MKDFDDTRKASLGYINKIETDLKKQLSVQTSARGTPDPIAEFNQEVETHYTNFLLAYTAGLPLKQNMQEFYQNVGYDFKTLTDKLLLNQNDKSQALTEILKNIDLAFLASAAKVEGLSQVSTIISYEEARKIVAEDEHKDYPDVVKNLVSTNHKHIQIKENYIQAINAVRTDEKIENKLDKIAKLNAKLQKDLNLNDRQINELNIGVGNYIKNNPGNFRSDLEKLKGNNKEEISREDITKYLNEKTAESYPTLSQTRAQAAKSAVLGVGKRATKTVTSQWQNSSKSEAALAEKPSDTQEIAPKSSGINEQTASDLNKTVEKGKKNTASSIIQKIPKKIKKIVSEPTQLERKYDAAIRRIDNDVNAKWKEIKQDARTRLGITSSGSHKMPPKVKEYATQIGHDALHQVKAKGNAEKNKRTLR
jgi:hypothetical protein